MMELDLNNKEGIEPVHFEAYEEMTKDLERNQKEESDEFDKALEVKGMPCICWLYCPIEC